MRNFILIAGLFALTATIGFGCSPFASYSESAKKAGNSGSNPSSGGQRTPAVTVDTDEVLAALPKGSAASLAVLCQKPGGDRFTSIFCSSNPPQIKGIRDLHTALNVADPANSACTTNSVSIVKNETSVLNPRCINFSHNGAAGGQATAVAYMRSETTLAEIVAQDPSTGEYRFFLVDFELPCETTVGGCTTADFFLEKAESNWTNVSFYEDTQLRGTVLDCASCHQPGGPGTRKLLRMAQTNETWTHWFRENEECGKQLLADFVGAHGGEGRYAGLTLSEVAKSDPARLENFVEDNGFRGPSSGNNFFDSATIVNDLLSASVSSTWQQQYNAISSMTNLPNQGAVTMPYYRCRQSDPARLVEYTKAYKDVRDNGANPNSMPSLATVNLAGEQDLRDRGLLPKAGLTPRQILVNACMACHNSNLDQALSRANFNAQDLTKNSSSVYDKAIARMAMDAHNVQRMPPVSYMSLTNAEVQSLIPYLKHLRDNGAIGSDAIAIASQPPPADKVLYFEDFNANSTSENIEVGVYHRNMGWQILGQPLMIIGDSNAFHGGSWKGDYDLMGGGPGTERTLSSQPNNFHVDQLNYMAHDHWMTSMGDVDGFSILWFSPAKAFQNVGLIEFDVSLPNLGARQWWEVSVVSDSVYKSMGNGGVPTSKIPAHIRSEIGAASVNGSVEDSGILVFTYSGPMGYPGGLRIGAVGGADSNPSPNDKFKRHKASIKDNGDGTVTFTVAGRSFTRRAAFPTGPVRIVFSDHNYTPDKDGVPLGHTWHWDNIRVSSK
ncbi:MAG: hypothetical protein AB7F86_06205 [Bdellovibrionales bacterium]